MSESRHYVVPNWDEVYEMLVKLAIRMKESAFRPDLIVGVSRGGWVPGRILSDMLANTHTANIKIEFYVGIGKTGGKPIVTQPISEDITNKKILVVDDVADTGESLLVALEHVHEKGAGEVRTVTLYHKPHSKFKPDFFAETTSDWIIFPWERVEATKLLIQEAQAQGLSPESVRETLRKCSIDEKTAAALLRLANGGT
jgi:hypoxanthine phosphoribosyltransferase